MRYLLFAKNIFYYAAGGAHDYICASDDLESLIEYAVINKQLDNYSCFDGFAWWHIFDTNERRIVAGTTSQAHGARDLKVDDNWRVQRK
jgi:hypothetical protein